MYSRIRTGLSIIVPTVFALSGAYTLMWCYQSASFSVAADPVMKEIYETRALLLLPIFVLFFAVSVLFFLVMRRRCHIKDDA